MLRASPHSEPAERFSTDVMRPGDRGEGDEHAQDRCAAANVKDNLVSEKMFILVYSVPVGSGAHFIFLWTCEQESAYIQVGSDRRTSISSCMPIR